MEEAIREIDVQSAHGEMQGDKIDPRNIRRIIGEKLFVNSRTLVFITIIKLKEMKWVISLNMYCSPLSVEKAQLKLIRDRWNTISESHMAIRIHFMNVELKSEYITLS